MALKGKPRPRIQPDMRERVRVLTLDIETRPHEAYVFGLWKQDIGIAKLMERGHVMCFVAKWYGEKEVIFRSDHHDGHEAMIRAAWDLLNEADLIVTYNGISFDMPHLNREFALLGLSPPSPYKDIDLIRVVRKQFNFSSNSLANVVEELGIGSKMDTGGFELWRGCMNDDPKAWAKMKRYNVRDVAITERLYDRLRPWIKGHPHLGMFSGDEWSCPNCGNQDISTNRQGEAHTFVQRYKQFQCPKCGTWIRSNRRLQNPVQTRHSR
ncbi:RNase H superfamily protein [Brevibacterium sanguinis]|uniref:RNase H superfamily protein n=2 Tax=Brevibacterium TaxID=1696 RepID=A0A366ILE9_9MICO|nr:MULTISPECIES: ribonuclease H-like domain-containing protein [Brevibacterium]RBP66396.1 RNase H superfamily protein [Brevibacterium sanguinis]RBP73048.1 RNase H superfamily protein [Brevibacterium celere]